MLKVICEAMVSGEGLPSSRDKDLAMLRSSGVRRQSLALIKTFGAFVGLLIGALFALFAIHQYRADTTDPAIIEQQLIALDSEWAVQLAESQRSYRHWFNAHGTATEAMLFDDVSRILLQSVLSIAEDNADSSKLSFFSTLYISLHAGLIRILFICITMARLLIVAIGIAIYLGFRSFRPYLADDLLGQSGNGRIFYSGVRVGLDRVTPNGAPDLLLRGLACPPHATAAESMATDLWALLEEFEAANTTNCALISIILKNRDIKPYVSHADEDMMLAQWFDGGDLLDNATILLQNALTLHALYAAGDTRGSPPNGATLDSSMAAPKSPLSSTAYGELLQTALHRSLDSDGRQLLGAISAAELATTLLSIESGKVLAYAFEGGRWSRKSNFLHLQARAVLHSVKEYPSEYPYEVRGRIRQALVYASRHSAFAPVRMPIDMTEDTWALRQWVELHCTLPHELPASCDEVELVGLVRSAHNGWLQEFLDGSIAFRPEIAKNSFATPSNLMFVPVARLAELVRKSATPAEIRRLEELSSTVSARQRLRALEAENTEGEPSEGPSVERVYPPLDDETMKQLIGLHDLTEADLRDWAAFRVVLTSFGWLARRVGDYTVPESSIIFTTFISEEAHQDANSFGIIGRVGMVPIRGSRLEDRWGKNWAQRFTVVTKATMAETKEDYEKLLRGIDDRDEEDLKEGATPAIA